MVRLGTFALRVFARLIYNYPNASHDRERGLRRCGERGNAIQLPLVCHLVSTFRRTEHRDRHFLPLILFSLFLRSAHSSKNLSTSFTHFLQCKNKITTIKFLVIINHRYYYYYYYIHI